jgi:UDP-2,3-diacylglucosamine pyrophosphatase LpxH
MNHDQLLSKLLADFPGQVFLAGRYRNPDLKLKEDGVMRIFIPDFHWMSQERANYYRGGYRFNGNILLPNNKPVFSAFLEILENDADGKFEVFQLGDSYDLWREIKDLNESIEEIFLRIQGDPTISGLIARLKDLKTSFIQGNHDHWLVDLPSHYPESQNQKTLEVADGKIHLCHGHQYDGLEKMLPDDIKALGVLISPNAKAQSLDVGLFSRKDFQDIGSFIKLRSRSTSSSIFPFPEVKPLGAFLINGVSDLDALDKDYFTYLDVSIFYKQPEERNDFDHISFLEFADKIYIDELNHPNDHCIHVIGHTHRARLLVDVLSSGAPHVVLDCGGWIENCKIRTQPKGRPYYVPSTQFACQYGNELRIYQLGGNC